MAIYNNFLFKQLDWNYYLDDLTARDYTQTYNFRYETEEITRAIEEIYTLESEEKIQSRDVVVKTDIDLAIFRLFRNIYRNEILYILANQGIYDDGYGDEFYGIYSGELTYDEKNRQTFDLFISFLTKENYDKMTALWEKFEEEYETQINNERETVINNYLSEFQAHMKTLKNAPHFYYYIKTDGNVYSNTDVEPDKFIEHYKYSFYVQDYDDWEVQSVYYEKYYQNLNHDSIVEDVMYAFDEGFIEMKNEEFASVIKEMWAHPILIAIFALAFAVCIFYLAFITVKQEENKQGDVKSHPLDKLPLELTLGFIILAIIGIYDIQYNLHWLSRIQDDNMPVYNITIIPYISLNTAACMAIIAVCIFLFLSIVRRVKNKKLLKSSLLYMIYSPFGKIYESGTPMRKTVGIVIVIGLLTMIPFVGFLTIPLAIWFIYRRVYEYMQIKEGVKRIKNGVYDEPVNLNGNSEFKQIADDLNNITQGISDEVERRTKSERLKTELIVNVSHDIRTPLTSVINYTDLLKKEKIDNENIKKYVDIIDVKSKRLKVLIDDLFDASKAASGNIAVNMEQVDINALITQGLGELDDKIKASGLDFKVKLPEQKIIAKADGKLLWRAIQNLLSNVLKYSLEKSRVYIDVFAKDNKAYIEIKNISNKELNIPEDELFERFKRGDESRSSEGSGLGLDIAKSLMLCQNGDLQIKVDGDLFKAIILIDSRR